MPCIYCQSNGPFNKEHVIPASLGGDDQDWILYDCVCIKCNSLFSKFEASVARGSDIAIDRLELQKTGRNRGSKTQSTRVNWEHCFFYNAKANLILEANIIQGHKVNSLSQIIINDNDISYSGSNKEVDILFSTLKTTVKDELTIITKEKNAEAQFTKHKVDIKNNPSEVYTEYANSIKEKDCVWFQELTYPTDFVANLPNNVKAKFPPRIWVRDGKINFRAKSINEVIETYKYLHYLCSDNLFDEIISDLKCKPENIETKVSKVEAVVDEKDAVTSRLYAKTAINLIARIYGPEFARSEYFDKVRKHVLLQEKELHCLTYGELESPLGDIAENKHIFKLCLIQSSGQYFFTMYCRLYKQPVRNVVLSIFNEPPSFYNEPIYIHCDYINNKIELVSEQNHLEVTQQAYDSPKKLLKLFMAVTVIFILLIILMYFL